MQAAECALDVHRDGAHVIGAEVRSDHGIQRLDHPFVERMLGKPRRDGRHLVGRAFSRAIARECVPIRGVVEAMG